MRYIKATVDSNPPVHIEGDWLDDEIYGSHIHDDGAIAISPQFITSISFDEDAGFLEVDSVPETTVQHCLQFGMIIVSDAGDDVLCVPAGMEFQIALKPESYSYTITHNGIDMDWETFEGYPICIHFTPLGYRCFLATWYQNSSRSREEA